MRDGGEDLEKRGYMKRIMILFISGVLSLITFEQLMSEDFILIKANSFKGSAYDIGFKEGKEVIKNEPFFKQVLKASVFTKATESNFNEVSRLLKEFDEDILAEMKGFSDASDIPFEDIVVKLSGWGITKPAIPHGCTQIAILPNKTFNHHLLVGRNYDYSADKNLTDFSLVLLYPDTFKSSIGTSQFIFGRIEGMNKDGLYAGMSFAHGIGRNENGFFFPIIIRMILDKCKDTKEALVLIKKIPHSCAYNYLIADKNNAVAVEVSPPKIAIRYPENSLIVVVNHYIKDEMKTEQKWLMPNSQNRYKLAISKLNKVINLDDLKIFLSSPIPKGVCQNYYKDYLGTLWSAVFDLTDNKVYYSFGSPSLNNYNIIDFKNGEILNKTIKGILPENEPLTN